MTLIYILKLEKNKIYIGQTDNLQTTYEEHINGIFCDWTKLYKPYKIERLFDFEMNSEFGDLNKITEDYMSTYGINNVRGGIYSNIELETNQIFYLESELNQKYILEDNNPEFYFEKYKDCKDKFKLTVEINSLKFQYIQSKNILDEINFKKILLKLNNTSRFSLENSLEKFSLEKDDKKDDLELILQEYKNQLNEYYDKYIGEKCLYIDDIVIKYYDIIEEYKEYMNKNSHITEEYCDNIILKIKFLMNLRSLL